MSDWRDTARELIASGVSVNDVCRQIGKSENAVRFHLNINGAADRYRARRIAAGKPVDALRPAPRVRPEAPQLLTTITLPRLNFGQRPAGETPSASAKAVFDWSTVSDHSLAQLARQFTAAQIANKLGCSRNAVIGRCARRGISLSSYIAPRVEPIQRAANRRATDRQRYAAKRGKLAAAEPIQIVDTRPPVPHEPQNVTILDLRDGLCRWPLWSKTTPYSDKRYCGSETAPGKVYCDHCSTLAYAPRRTESLDRKIRSFVFKRAA